MPWLRTGSQHDTVAAERPAVRIFTADLELRGAIAPTGQRVTDILLRGQDLSFLPEGAQPDPESWVLVSPGDVLFVVPPPLLSPSRPPDRYRLVEAWMRVGAYRLRGSIHLREDAEVGPQLADHQPFLPITAVIIERPDGGEEAVDVAIVNLAHADGPHPVA